MSTTPSPTKRTALSSKSFNISPTPLKRSNPYLPSKLSPTKRLSPTRITSPKKQPGLNFTIWEDKIEKASESEPEQGPFSNKQNTNDQENILQPKKHDITRSSARSPLTELSINEYPGFVSTEGTTMKLTELYQPPNFNNEFKSLHKYSNLPSYLTPGRRNRDRYLVVSNSQEIEDETELLLLRKQQRLNKTNIIRKHTRSLSVGKNDSKLNLIRKNKFSILSN
ncbi:hypothetical protein JA1_000129 [Spathaspora sp. JA1]|nr:hypothetical protein JA1_000129 [Spathaspora sp. JA1]